MYTQISYDLKPSRKTFASISSEMTLPWHFVQKFPFSYFWKSFQCLNVLKEMLFIHATKPFKFAYCVSSWLTNVLSWRLNKYTFSVSLNSPFMLFVFLHEMHRSKVTERKTALKRVNCNNVRAKRISFDNLSWGSFDWEIWI